MTRNILFGLAGCLLASWCTGCTSAPGVVRGQSPAGPGGGVEHAQYFGDRGSVTPVAHDACENCGRGDCDGGDGCRLFNHGTGGTGEWRPTHYHWYTYEAPRNLVYPPQNVPASVVQYPYYTCKGPDDFFKKY